MMEETQVKQIYNAMYDLVFYDNNTSKPQVRTARAQLAAYGVQWKPIYNAVMDKTDAELAERYGGGYCIANRAAYLWHLITRAFIFGIK